MLLALTGARPLIFVGGKGGVGKTSTASALALAHATAGERVLLISTDPAHNLGHIFGEALGDEPRRIFTAGGGADDGGAVDGVEIDPQLTVDRHLAAVYETMRLMLPERMHRHAKQHLDLARDAPGSHESAVLERLADLVSEGLRTHDRVIVDTAPTGHTLRLLRLPAQLTSWAETLITNRDRSERFGAAMRGLTSAKDAAPERSAEAELRHTLVRRRERFAALHASLTDPQVTGFVIVLTPERIPVTETIELAGALHDSGLQVTALVANRRSPAEGAGLLATRSAVEREHLATLTAALPHIALFEVPLLEAEPVGVEGLARLAKHYGRGAGALTGNERAAS